MMLNRIPLTCVCALAASLGCSKQDSEKEAVKVVAPTTQPEKPAPQVEPTEPTEPQSSPATSSISVAMFTGDELANCADISLTLLSQGLGLKAEQLALIIADDTLGWMTDKETLIGKGELAAEQGFMDLVKYPLNHWVQRAKEQEDSGVDKEGKPLTKKKLREIKERIDGLTQVYASAWPLLNYRDEIERGDITRIKSCASTQKFEFGSCVVSVQGPEFTTQVTWHHYNLNSTKDSDKGMKECLKAGGEWTAPSKDDPKAALERMQQRSKDLQKILN